MSLVWSPLAIKRVSEISAYIAQDNLIAAERWVDKIFESVERLSDFPESGRAVPEIGSTKFRELIFGNYRVIYKYENADVEILTVRHGRQILPIEEIKTGSSTF